MSTHSFCFALLLGKIICHPHYWNHQTCRERSEVWRITVVTRWAPVQCHENVITPFSTWFDSTTSTHSVRNWLLSDWNVYITARSFFALVVIIDFSWSLTTSWFNVLIIFMWPLICALWCPTPETFYMRSRSFFTMRSSLFHHLWKNPENTMITCCFLNTPHHPVKNVCLMPVSITLWQDLLRR